MSTKTKSYNLTQKLYDKLLKENPDLLKADKPYWADIKGTDNNSAISINLKGEQVSLYVAEPKAVGCRPILNIPIDYATTLKCEATGMNDCVAIPDRKGKEHIFQIIHAEDGVVAIWSKKVLFQEAYNENGVFEDDPTVSTSADECLDSLFPRTYKSALNSDWETAKKQSPQPPPPTHSAPANTAAPPQTPAATTATPAPAPKAATPQVATPAAPAHKAVAPQVVAAPPAAAPVETPSVPKPEETPDSSKLGISYEEIMDMIAELNPNVKYKDMKDLARQVSDINKNVADIKLNTKKALKGMDIEAVRTIIADHDKMTEDLINTLDKTYHSLIN